MYASQSEKMRAGILPLLRQARATTTINVAIIRVRCYTGPCRSACEVCVTLSLHAHVIG